MATHSPKAPAGADPGIPTQDAPSVAAKTSDAARRLQRVRFLDRPFPAPSAAHDAALGALGLLNFVRLDLSSSGAPRPDLVAELIANYSYSRQCISVRGKKIEVSLDASAMALCLPGRPTDRPLACVDPAAVASAAREFIKVYFPPRIRLNLVDPALVAVKHGRAHAIEWRKLIWGQVMIEMVLLAKMESTDQGSYYGAYMQRLIWVQRPELFQLPWVPPVADAPAPSCCPQQESDMQKTEIASKKFDLASENFTAASKKIDFATDKFDAASKKFDSVSDIVYAASKMMEANPNNSKREQNSLAIKKATCKQWSRSARH